MQLFTRTIYETAIFKIYKIYLHDLKTNFPIINRAQKAPFSILFFICKVNLPIYFFRLFYFRTQPQFRDKSLKIKYKSRMPCASRCVHNDLCLNLKFSLFLKITFNRLSFLCQIFHFMSTLLSWYYFSFSILFMFWLCISVIFLIFAKKSCVQIHLGGISESEMQTKRRD